MTDFATPHGCPTDQATVLQAVVDRLRDQVSELRGENLCFLSMKPTPRTEVRQNIYATVCPMGGTYDPEMFAGAGAAGVWEKTGVIVTVFSRMQLDRSDGDELMLLHDTRGLLKLKKLILKALSDHDLLGADGNPLLLEAMAPLSSGHPRDNNESVGEFSLSFSTDFIWDLE